ncbi:MAG: putative diheme cytochrome c-553 [Myxococcales bacterium]|nr:putative diheme cytochrome c-553 [Myxococcales bacterium]
MMIMRGWRVVAIAVTLLVACGDDRKAPAVADAASPHPDAGRTVVERGRYIMNNLGVCTFCHTPLNPDGTRDLTRLFAGVDCFIDIDPGTPNFGCISTRNLTNDATGLKNATDTQIKNAFLNGMRTDGKAIAPVMPYYIFHNMTNEDADAIVAYLRTVPGVNHTVQPNEEPWASINNGGMPAPPITDAQIPAAAAGNASAARGRYLSAKVGLCIECHTPMAAPTNPVPIDMTRPFAGGRVFFASDLGVQSPPYPAMINVRNITPDATGIAGFSTTDIIHAVADGKDKMGNAVCAGTHGSGISPYAALDKRDLADIAEYIHGLPPIVNDTSPNCAGPPVP